jgi:hypothetical protein
MELKVQSEKVLEAAKSCPDWERLLKTLFPEAFKKADLEITENNIGDFLGATIDPPFRGKGFWLSPRCNWEIVNHPLYLGYQYLIPTLK